MFFLLFCFFYCFFLGGGGRNKLVDGEDGRGWEDLHMDMDMDIHVRCLELFSCACLFVMCWDEFFY